MHADPRQWKVVIDGQVMTSFEELLNRLHEAGFPIRRDLRSRSSAFTVVHKQLLAQLYAERATESELRARSARETEALRQQGPTPDYRLFEEEES